MVSKDQLSKLEMSLDKERSLSILRDMQLYVDEVVSSLNNKFKLEMNQQLRSHSKLINSKYLFSNDSKYFNHYLDSDKLSLSDLNPIFQKFDQLEHDFADLSLRINLDQEKGDLKAVENVLSMHFEQSRKYEEEIKELKDQISDLKKL